MTRTILASALALGLALGLGAGAADAGPGWWGDLDKGQVVELQDIIAKPASFKDRQLTFTCITSGKANVFFQESAIISRQRYTNYAVWPDGAIVWREREYKGKDFPFLFIAKSHFQHDELLGLRKFTRIEVTGRIKAILRNKAHIEVTSWRPTSHRFGRLVWDAMRRGDLFADAGDWDMAVVKYEEALRPDLPPAYALAIRKQLAAGLRQLGRHAEAEQVEGGGILTPDDFRKNGGAQPGALPPPAFPPARGPDTPQPGSGLPPPIDDQLPGTVVNPGQGAQPTASGGIGAPPAVVPQKSRGERANPFLDEDLPGTSGAAPREPGFQPIPRRQPTAPPQPAQTTGNGFPPPDNGFPQPTPSGTTPQGLPPQPAPQPAPFAPGGDDLPGTPVNPVPAQPPVTQKPAAVPAVPASQPSATPARRPGRPILPPKRRPRLSGVK